MTSLKLSFILSLIIAAIVPNANAAGAPMQMVIENQVVSPAIKFDGTKWIVNIVTIRGIYKNSNFAMRVPCITTDPSAGIDRMPPVNPILYKNYGCVAQFIPAGPYKGSLIDQEGQVFAPPPQ
jgi:hypothetical protein